MNIVTARANAAQAWCKENTSHKVFDPDIADEFAKILVELMDREAQECTNYYKGLVEEIGKMFGEDAYISDDGSKQDSILCAKVPELVSQLIKSRSLPRGGFF